MNSQEAKRILALFRPGCPEANEPELAEALEQAGRDPDLRRWFEQSCAFHAALRAKFEQIPVPPDLREKLLSTSRVVIKPLWWQRPAWLAAAAALVLLIGLATLWVQPKVRDRFTDYRARMVRTVLKKYSMELFTSNHGELRKFLGLRGAPADYVIPPSLQKLTLTGGASLRWRENPVSMICFDPGDKQMLFLFVLGRTALRDAPSTSVETAKVNKLMTESWTEGDKTYLLAGPEDSPVLQEFKRSSQSGK